MNEDAFARRFYADRAELEALRHRARGREADRRVCRAGELLAAAGELPPRPRSSSPTRSWRRSAPRCSCSTASSPTPSRCGWRCSRSPGAIRARSRRPSSARSRSASPARPAATTSRSAWRRSRRRSSAARRSCSTTTRWSATRPARAGSIPTSCFSRAASSTSSAARTSASAIRVFRLSRIQGKVGYATKAEHDFQRPANFDPRDYAKRDDWQFGEPSRHRRDLDRPTGSPGRSSATSAATARCGPTRPRRSPRRGPRLPTPTTPTPGS